MNDHQCSHKMKTTLIIACLLSAAISSAVSELAKNEPTAFWLSSELKPINIERVKRLPDGVRDGGDFSSSIADLKIDKQKSHWVVSGIVKAHITNRTYIFLGERDLVDDHLVIPISMADNDNRFSFRIEGSAIVTKDNFGKLSTTGDYHFPSFLYVAAIGQPIRRINLTENSHN